MSTAMCAGRGVPFAAGSRVDPLTVLAVSRLLVERPECAEQRSIPLTLDAND